MENTKNACVGYAILWIATIALRWVISDPEGTLSDLLTYWIVHPVAIAVATGYIAANRYSILLCPNRPVHRKLTICYK